jgi:hypothetical protein
MALGAGIVIGAAAISLDHPSDAQALAHAAAAAPFVPACPHPTYSPDGNVTPLFCRIDNPVALRFYEKLAPKLFALGPNATPLQVQQAVTAAEKVTHATLPEACSAYKLAKYWRHWSFPSFEPVQYCSA